MLEKPKPDADLLRTHTQEDLTALVVKTSAPLLGYLLNPELGLVWSAMGEVFSQLVPGQRVDRLHDYVDHLEDRLTGLEAEFQKHIHESAGYVAFVERATLVAAQPGSTRKRRDIAGLVKTGLTRTEVELEAHDAFLRMLERINDSQVLLLMYYNLPQTYGNPDLASFTDRHPDVFPLAPTNMDSDDVVHRWTIKEAYVKELVTIGLLEEAEGIARRAGSREVQLTDLGRYFLAAIDRETTEATSEVLRP
jgi:hypothetical protein